MKSSSPARHSMWPSFFRSAALLALMLAMSVSTIKTGASNQSAEDGFKPNTVFLVRHAEKAAAPPADPPLTEAGNARSLELARMLAQAGIKAIYTSQFLRTKQTAEPLAKSLGIAPLVLPIRMSTSNPREVSEQSIREITEKIHERAGETALVVGHSNTVPEVIKMLGGDVAPVIDEKEFNDLFVVTVYARGKAKVARLKYGDQR